MKSFVSLLAIFLISFVSESEQLTCYTCEEGVNHLYSSSSSLSSARASSVKCANFPSSVLTTCSSNQVCMTIRGESNGWSSAIRRCGNEQDCYDMDGRVEMGVTTTCRSCKTDACNGPVDPPKQMSCYHCATELNDFTSSYGINTLCNGDQSTKQTCSSTSETCYALTGTLNGKTTYAYTCGSSSSQCTLMNGQGNKGYAMTCKSCTSNTCNLPKTPGNTLQCYECEKKTTSSKLVKGSRAFNSDCGTFDENVVVDCSPSADSCVKVDQEIGGETVSKYSCGTKKDCNYEGCYSCTSSKCNGASGLVAFGMTIVATLAVAVAKMQ